ncbi:MAG: class I SAM-dependent methyltransferase [Pseudomonadota bacterium]
MSGFSADWLTLREPYDHAARDKVLVKRFAKILSGLDKTDLRILDLASGTGSTVRAIASQISTDHFWTLTDFDEALLKEAASAAASHANVECKKTDLSATDALSLESYSAVTTSAFLDLVSEEWLDAFTALLTETPKPVYAALSYDGRIAFSPGHDADDEIISLVNEHQRTDKGFGPALGPDAGDFLSRRLGDNGWTVETATSDWVFKGTDQRIQAELVKGWAQAALETAPEKGTTISAWHDARLNQIKSGALQTRVGHIDLLAHPPE